MTTTADELVDSVRVELEERGEVPTNEQPGQPRRAPGGPKPWLVVGGALAAGIALAKALDRRGRAHPND